MLDLFGAVPVTAAEIDAWLLAVAGLKPGSPRAAAYVKAWDVAGKVAAAKLAGTFHAITEKGTRARWPEFERSSF